MKKRKLRLHRETIRLLDPDQLSRAAGANHLDTNAQCDTTDCFTNGCNSNPTHCGCNTQEVSCDVEGSTRPVNYCNSTTLCDP